MSKFAGYGEMVDGEETKEMTLQEYIDQLPVTHKAIREYGQLKRFAKERQEALDMLEQVAAAGARLTALAGGGEVINGDLQFPSKEGVFSEHIAHQRIRAMQKRIKELEEDRDSLKRELYKIDHPSQQQGD